MILDSLDRLESYCTMYPKIRGVVRFLQENDPETLPVGKISIDRDNVFVNVSETDLKPESEALLEIHRRYIDIQMPVTPDMEERFGWSPREILSMPNGAFDTEKDIQFFGDAPQTVYGMRRGQFSIFTPDDAHAPMLGSGRMRKLIFKVEI